MRTVQTLDRKGFPTDEDNQNLSTKNDSLDTYEPPVPEETVEDVEIVINTARTGFELASQHPSCDSFDHLLPLVEDLHPDKGVKHHRVEPIDANRMIEYRFSSKVQDERDNQLIYTLSNHHLPHCCINERRRFRFRPAIEKMGSRRVGCYNNVRKQAIQDIAQKVKRTQSKSGECIHDKVHPQQLYSREH